MAQQVTVEVITVERPCMAACEHKAGFAVKHPLLKDAEVCGTHISVAVTMMLSDFRLAEEPRMGTTFDRNGKAIRVSIPD